MTPITLHIWSDLYGALETGFLSVLDPRKSYRLTGQLIQRPACFPNLNAHYNF